MNVIYTNPSDQKHLLYDISQDATKNTISHQLDDFTCQ